ncbi:MAG: 2-oxo acid dehydrogenase subunit E2, partial [Deltaproteobacteria bacterium]|nr:2-oxo acid dehydrogenase subunit E2 [Deltaproteobacteria bacterium]
MATSVHMPQWGMTMTEGKIVKWLKCEGEPIEKGEPLFEVETEKIVNEVEALHSGILFQIVVQEGETTAVGEVVGLIAEPGETATRIETADADRSQPAQADEDLGEETTDMEPANEKPFVKATPAARWLSRELSIDLATIQGSGPGGRVTESDVKQAQEAQPKAQKITPVAQQIAEKAGLDITTIDGTGTGGKITKADVEQTLAAKEAMFEPVSGPATTMAYAGMRKSIGDNMMASLHNAAQLTGFAEVDVTEMVRFRDMMRKEHEQDESVKISFNDIIILAVSRALKHHPIMNSTHEGDEIVLHEAVNMGIAVAIPEGLIVPVLKNADRKGLLEIAREARVLARKARSGALGPDEVSGGTFTISNTGMFEVDGFTPILRPPETGILGAGRVKRKPAEFNGDIALRWMMWLSLTYNHCVVDGAPAHKFLETVGG